METGIAEVNGAGLYHEVSGEGRPLVLIHDGLLDRRIWDDQFGVFSASHKTVRYDVRGHGRSEAPAGGFSHIEDLRALLGFLGVRRAHLVGASNGGRIAVDFAFEHPSMVGSLILAGSGLSGYRISEETRRRVSEAFAAAREGDARRWTRTWLDDPFWAPDPGHVAARRRLEPLLLEAFRRFHSNPPSHERRSMPAAGRLGEVKVPALVLVGEKDSPDNHAIADVLGSGIAGARKVVIRGAAHMPSVERPEEFNRLVLRFLEGLSEEMVR